MRVAFLGLGALGAPMATHVARKFAGVVWNRTRSRAEEVARATGAVLAESPAEAVLGSEVVITCMPTSLEVEQLIDAAKDAWRRGQLLVDCTSGDPAASRRIAARLEALGVGFVDAPVSGGTDGARAAKLTVMLGCDERWLALANEVCSAFGSRIVHAGPVGAAHALKAVNNALLAANIQAAGEGLAALAKFGVDPGLALDVINASSGRSNVTENLFPHRVLTGAWPRTFRLALLDKDVRIARQLLQEMGVDSHVIAATSEAMARAHAALGEEADHVEAVKVIEEQAGVEIR